MVISTSRSREIFINCLISCGIGSPGAGEFLMSGIRVCATDQGRFFTSKNPEQAPKFEVLLQNRPYLLKVYSRTGSFLTIWSQTPGSNVKIPVAFSFCFLQPDVFTFVLLYLSKCFKLSITGISLSQDICIPF